MPGYSKLKNPFKAKTYKLEEGLEKEFAKHFKSMEEDAVRSANASRQLKDTMKKCSTLTSKISKEQNESKKEKLNSELDVQKARLTAQIAVYLENTITKPPATLNEFLDKLLGYLKDQGRADYIKQTIANAQAKVEELKKTTSNAKT